MNDTTNNKKMFQWVTGEKCQSPKHHKRNWEVHSLLDWKCIGIPPYGTETWVINAFCDCKLIEIKDDLILDPNKGL
jgi:hypothetical protein